MKKSFLSIILAVTTINVSAQLEVNSQGQVKIGTGTALSVPLSVLGEGGDEFCAYFSGTKCGIQIDNYGSYSVRRGIRLTNSANNNNDIYGLFTESVGSSTSGVLCGVLGQGTNLSTSRNIGVLGNKPSGSNSGAGIYGIAGYYSSATFTDYPGTYAGFFRGDVRVTDNLYYNTLLTAAVNSPSASVGSVSESSSARIITDEGGERISDKLQQVDLLQFVREDNDTEEKMKAYYEADGVQDDEKGEKDFTIAHNKVSAIQYGLAADQLKAVYPELVYEDENGNVSINYIELVPLLVKGLNEVSQELAELKGTTGKKAKAKAETTSIEETASEVDMVRMDQNKPNPFSESTVITLNIPEGTQKANIFIYDMSGKQVQAIPVNERGETNITVYASDLTAGMYIYTLVVDGKVAVTRKMIVSQV